MLLFSHDLHDNIFSHNPLASLSCFLPPRHFATMHFAIVYIHVHFSSSLNVRAGLCFASVGRVLRRSCVCDLTPPVSCLRLIVRTHRTEIALRCLVVVEIALCSASKLHSRGDCVAAEEYRDSCGKDCRSIPIRRVQTYNSRVQTTTRMG
jgi:hypothetical protein